MVVRCNNQFKQSIETKSNRKQSHHSIVATCNFSKKRKQ
ncbi:hypothetical protein COLO4_33345 [Corchorus olitorius]|uniref:Uncharacterized protein n=1 Tax=Corchorus olitorius TaxID=93759 RepID=A0A1R3GUH4_9ROSI|nr:hypothetical protein COLO4_33345 [Corchorus olitorius]